MSNCREQQHLPPCEKVEQVQQNTPHVIDISIVSRQREKCTLDIAKNLTLIPEQGVLIVDVSTIEELSGQCISSVKILIAEAFKLLESTKGHLLIRQSPELLAMSCDGDILLLGRPSFCSEYYFHSPFLLADREEIRKDNGCLTADLSSFIQLFLQQGWTVPDAVILGKAFANYLIQQNVDPWKQEQAITSFQYELSFFPRVLSLDTQGAYTPSTEEPFVKLSYKQGIYPVVSDLETIRTLLKAGCKTLQLRIKTESSRDIEQVVKAAVSLGKQYQAQLFINDHWQLAIKYGAYGVHLGQEDLQHTDLDAIKKAGLALGLSSHSYFEALIAIEQKPSYLALGHIFPTTTKTMPSLPQGVARLSQYSRTFTPVLPTVAIGGIDLTNLEQIKATTVSFAATVRAVTQAVDPGVAFTELEKLWSHTYAQRNNVKKDDVGKSNDGKC